LAEEEQIGSSAPMGGTPQGSYQRQPREEYETIKMETINYGTNNFIEVAKKKAPNGNIFISISKGWYPQQSTEKRYKAGIGFPMEKELVDRFTGALSAVLQE